MEYEYQKDIYTFVHAITPHTIEIYLMRTLPLFLVLIIALSVKPYVSYSQNESKDSIANYAELAWFGGSTERTAFWLQSNQFGLVPKTSPTGTVRIGIEQYFNLTAKESTPWKVGFGAEAVGNFSENRKFLFPQLHATLRYKNWELFVGRKKQWVGLADSTLGTGSYPWSTNAMPIPRIQIGTRNFVSVPFTKGWVSFNAFYSDGIMDRNRPITSELKLHQKGFYLRIGRQASILKLYGGFNHQVQWGGKSPYFTGPDGNLPDGFKSYLNVVTGKQGIKVEGFDFFDSSNRIGNHLGSIDLAAEIETFGSSIFIYRQTLFEDGSLFYLKGLKDGLNGISVRGKNSYMSDFEITEGVFEFLYTKDQGGDDFVLTDGKKRGRDNYFNNQQIRDGWSYFDRTIGSPFIPPTSDTKWNWPVNGDNFTSNNRIMVFHIGLKGTFLQNFIWSTKLSFSNNGGSYAVPFDSNPTQFSGLVDIQSRINFLGGAIVKASFAADAGDLYPRNFGFSLGLKKDGILFIR